MRIGRGSSVCAIGEQSTALPCGAPGRGLMRPRWGRGGFCGDTSGGYAALNPRLLRGSPAGSEGRGG